jgi:ankyrin repeat protein
VVAIRKGLKTAAVAGKPVVLSAAPMERDGVTYVPVRFVSEAFGAGVAKIDTPQEVSIVHPKTKETLLLSCLVGPDSTCGALHIDAYAGLTAQAGKRLAAGADINETDAYGMPPLAYAIVRAQVEMVELLLEKGARADICAKPEAGGWTMLHVIALAKIPGMLTKPDRMDAAGQARMKTIAEALMTKGADCKRVLPPPYGTPLHMLAGAGQCAAAEAVIAKGADVNARVEGGVAPLHFAVVGEKLEAVKLLLDKGADINAKTDDGDTAISLAKEGELADMVALLKARGAKE